MKKTFEERLLASMEDAVAYAKGDKTRGRSSTVSMPIEDVKEIRKKTGLSQQKFSEVFGVNIRTLQEWEQRRRVPSGAARTLLAVMKTVPEAIPIAMQSIGRASLTKKRKTLMRQNRSIKKVTRSIDGGSPKSRTKKIL